MSLLTDEESAALLKDAPTYQKVKLVRARPLDKSYIVKTHEGELLASAGSYLVQNTSGDSKPWPVKAEIFHDSYRLHDQNHYPARDHRELDPKHPDFLAREWKSLTDVLIDGDYMGSTQGETDVALNMAHFYVCLDTIVRQELGFEKYHALHQKALDLRNERWPFRPEEYDKLTVQRRMVRGSPQHCPNCKFWSAPHR